MAPAMPDTASTEQLVSSWPEDTLSNNTFMSPITEPLVPNM